MLHEASVLFNWGEIDVKQERIVLERSARLNLDPGKGDKGDG